MRLLSLAATVVTATGLFLAAPAESKADHPRVGISVGVGDFRFSYNNGYNRYVPVHPRVVVPTYVVPAPTYIVPTPTYVVPRVPCYDDAYIVTPRSSLYIDPYRPRFNDHHHDRHRHGHPGHPHHRH